MVGSHEHDNERPDFLNGEELLTSRATILAFEK